MRNVSGKSSCDVLLRLLKNQTEAEDYRNAEISEIKGE